MKQITVFGHAKINLTLEVIGKRPDGYHEIRSVMQSLALADEVTVVRKPAGVSVQVESGNGAVDIRQVPCDERNIAWRAARLLLDRSGVRAGVSISIKKHIPVAAGLAGGSTDAAAVLRAINRLFGIGLTRQELARIGSGIGADIPFCVFEGAAFVQGIGERVEPVPGFEFGVVLVKPPEGVSTAQVYREFDRAVGDRQGARKNLPVSSSEAVCEALRAKDLTRLASNLTNDLQQVTFSLRPELKNLAGKLQNAGCKGVLMSGSGPTIFGLTATPAEARQIASKLQELGRAAVLATRSFCKADGIESVGKGERLWLENH